jgi:TRAP-type C4-dicarboxylate transport system permease small subunit
MRVFEMSLDRILSGLAVVSRATQTVCQFILLLMLVITVAQIVARYFFSVGFPWAEEATRYLLVWMVMFGAGILVRIDDHLGIKAIQDSLPTRLRAAVRTVIFSFILCVAVLLAIYGYKFAFGSKFIISAGLQISMAWAYFALFFGAIPLAVYSFVNVIGEILVIATGTRCVEPRIEEERRALIQLLIDDTK